MVNEVWVLVYEHKHGSDISVYANERSALTAAAQILRDNSDDPGVLETLTDGDVLGAWRRHSDDCSEYVNIEHHVVQNHDNAVDELADATAEKN